MGLRTRPSKLRAGRHNAERLGMRPGDGLAIIPVTDPSKFRAGGVSVTHDNNYRTNGDFARMPDIEVYDYVYTFLRSLLCEAYI